MLWEECCNESSISVKVYQSDKMAHSAQLTVNSASVHISEVMMMKWCKVPQSTSVIHWSADSKIVKICKLI